VQNSWSCTSPGIRKGPRISPRPRLFVSLPEVGKFFSEGGTRVNRKRHVTDAISLAVQYLKHVVEWDNVAVTVAPNESQARAGAVVREQRSHVTLSDEREAVEYRSESLAGKGFHVRVSLLCC
jgi:hypothetical protein